MDLFYGTGTHYDKNCWVSGEVLWLSARSPSEYAGKRLKMAVSKRLADHHRAPRKISVLYAQTSSDHITQKVRKASRSSGLSIIYSQTPAFKILAAICSSVSSGYLFNTSATFLIYSGSSAKSSAVSSGVL